MRSDEEIKQDIEQELQWDPEIDSPDIAVSVNNGVVTLTGFVRAYAEIGLAEAAAKRVAGVTGVANDIELRIPGDDPKPDPEIYVRAAERLAVPACDCIVFEDSLPGLEAARNAGMRTVGIRTTHAELPHVDLAIDNFLSTELDPWLSQQTPRS